MATPPFPPGVFRAVITPTILPASASNKELDWATDGASNVSVNNGVVTFTHWCNKVTITATAKDGSGVKGSIDLTCGETGLTTL